MDLDNSKLIRLKIMDFLARRDHTAKEIFQKLEKRVESLDMLRAEIVKLEQEGLIDNMRFAEQYVYSRSKKGYGPVRIKSELINKGINKDIGKKIISSINWMSIAKQVLEKKVGNKKLIAIKENIKIKRFLIYRGFDYYQIEEAFSSLSLKENDTNE